MTFIRGYSRSENQERSREDGTSLTVFPLDFFSFARRREIISLC